MLQWRPFNEIPEMMLSKQQTTASPAISNNSTDTMNNSNDRITVNTAANAMQSMPPSPISSTHTSPTIQWKHRHYQQQPSSDVEEYTDGSTSSPSSPNSPMEHDVLPSPINYFFSTNQQQYQQQQQQCRTAGSVSQNTSLPRLYGMEYTFKKEIPTTTSSFYYQHQAQPQYPVYQQQQPKEDAYFTTTTFR